MAEQLPVPKVLGWQALYLPGAQAKCIKDNPPMKGFGRQLKKDEIVNVDGVCWEGKYTLAVKEQCAFYDLEGYFEVLLPKQEAV